MADLKPNRQLMRWAGLTGREFSDSRQADTRLHLSLLMSIEISSDYITTAITIDSHDDQCHGTRTSVTRANVQVKLQQRRLARGEPSNCRQFSLVA